MKLILLMAITADGKIARSADHFPDWTGSADKRFFARRGLIDEVILTVSPLIFGDGLSLFALGLDLRLSLLDVQRLDEDLVMLHYRVQR